MKKYTLAIAVFVFAFVLLGSLVFKANSADALSIAYRYPVGCTSTQGYSPITGEKCVDLFNPSLPAGCTSTQGFSPITGQPCNVTLPPGCTSTQGFSPTTGQPCSGTIYPTGCTSTQGFSPTTGQPCNGRIYLPPPMPVFPPGCSSYDGYSSTTGQPCSGTNSQNPVISGVSGPQSLRVGETGTWAVRASSPNGGNLSYSVNWGDEGLTAANTNAANQMSVAQQSATFTHSYSRAGTYNPTFTVANSTGQTARTSLSVNVVEARNTQPTISSLSPSSGPVGTQFTIIGTNFTPTGNTVSFGGVTTSNLPSFSDDGVTKYIIYTVPSNHGCPPLSGIDIMCQIHLSNANGISNSGNSVWFTVTGTSNLAITTTSLPSAFPRSNYEASIQGTGGSDSYTWKVSSGTLPPGLSLGTTVCSHWPCQVPVTIYGTPTAYGSYTFTMQVTSGGQSASKEFNIFVGAY